MSLPRCTNCSSPGRGIYHAGDCPGVRATVLDRLVSPFARSKNEEMDRKHYARASGAGGKPTRQENPGPYGDGRPKPLQVRRNKGVSVGWSLKGKKR